MEAIFGLIGIVLGFAAIAAFMKYHTLLTQHSYLKILRTIYKAYWLETMVSRTNQDDNHRYMTG